MFRGLQAPTDPGIGLTAGLPPSLTLCSFMGQDKRVRILLPALLSSRLVR